MNKSQLKILHNDNTIVIRKKMEVVTSVIYALIFIAGVLLPILFPNLRSLPIFWAVWGVCMLGSIVSFFLLLLGKIVVDTKHQTISIYNWCRETYRWDEVKEVRSVFEAGDSDGGPDQHKLVIQMADGYKAELHTNNKEQTEELAELLNTVLFSDDSKEKKDITNEERTTAIIAQYGFDFAAIPKQEIVALLEEEIVDPQQGSAEYLRILCGYLYCIGDETDIPLLEKVKYGIHMDVGCMIDAEWIESLKNGGMETESICSRENLMADFIAYYRNFSI